MMSSVSSASYQNILTSKIKSVNIAQLEWSSTFNQKFVSSVQQINQILMGKNVLPALSLNIGIEKIGYAQLVLMEESITRILINVNARRASFGQDIAALNVIIQNISI